MTDRTEDTPDATGATEADEQPATDPRNPEGSSDAQEGAQHDEPEDSEDSEDSDEQDESPNAEARRWRLRLREVEAERDRLTERIEGLQRQEVERIAADRLPKPSAIWAAGTELATLLDDDGAVDADRVTEAAETAAAELGVDSGVGYYMPHVDPMTANLGRPAGTATQRQADVVMGRTRR